MNPDRKYVRIITGKVVCFLLTGMQKSKIPGFSPASQGILPIALL
jgi:hypothetical protein